MKIIASRLADTLRLLPTPQRAGEHIQIPIREEYENKLPPDISTIEVKVLDAIAVMDWRRYRELCELNYRNNLREEPDRTQCLSWVIQNF